MPALRVVRIEYRAESGCENPPDEMFAHLEIVRIFVGQLMQFLEESIAAVELVLVFRVSECIENAIRENPKDGSVV